MTAEQAVRAGFDEIQHMNMIFLNFLADEPLDTRGPVRFTLVAEKGAAIDLDSPRVRRFVRLLKAHGVVLDATLNILSSMLEDRPGRISEGFAAVADRMPPSIRRGFLSGGLPVADAAADARARASFAAMKTMLRILWRSGVGLTAGTDNMAGFALPRELELYVEAGIPAPAVLKMATLDAARLARRGDRLGSIEPGKLADLILVDGDPSKTIGDIRRVRLVLSRGALYLPDDLDREIGVQPLPGGTAVSINEPWLAAAPKAAPARETR
jgi:hypothetical protein